MNYYSVNTYISKTALGNPTAIFFLNKPLTNLNKKLIALKIKYPVTVFLSEKENYFEIGYYTITGEIPACGHGTLAAAYLFFNKNKNSCNFKTTGGIDLKAFKNDDDIFITYPKYEGVVCEKNNNEIYRLLGVKNVKSQFFCKPLNALFIELETHIDVFNISPDYNTLIKKDFGDIEEVVVMSQYHHNEYDITVRVICPWIGIDEDDATGSIHSYLGHFWAERLNKNNLTVYQGSAKGGKVCVNVAPDLVNIGGKCQLIKKQVF